METTREGQLHMRKCGHLYDNPLVGYLGQCESFSECRH